MADTLFDLNTGAKIPALGLGTWQSEPGQVKEAVLHALRSGYRHIDCAWMYGNEDEVGEALQEAFKTLGLKREDVFVTSKLWCTYHSRVQQCLDMTLESLKLDYLDLYLMHWPLPMNPNGNPPKAPRLADNSRDWEKGWTHVKTWLELEKLPDTGKVKAVGVSNYSVKYLEELLSQAKITPAMNQIENHPFLPQQDVLDYCTAKGIRVTAYSPFGSTGGPLFTEAAVQEVAKKYSVPAGSILLSYQISRGVCVIPKSVTPSRIEENMKLVKLDASDLEVLNAIHKTHGVKRFIYPDFGVDLGFPDKS